MSNSYKSDRLQGYTGKWTAEYIITHLATDLKWAVAGRSESKLQAVVDECKKRNPDRLPPGMKQFLFQAWKGHVF